MGCSGCCCLACRAKTFSSTHRGWRLATPYSLRETRTVKSVLVSSRKPSAATRPAACIKILQASLPLLPITIFAVSTMQVCFHDSGDFRTVNCIQHEQPCPGTTRATNMNSKRVLSCWKLGIHLAFLQSSSLARSALRGGGHQLRLVWR